MFKIELKTFIRKGRKYKYKPFTNNNDKVILFTTKEEAEQKLKEFTAVFFTSGRVVEEDNNV